VAHGGRELGAALVEGHPDYIFFTGSVRTGRMVAEAAARQLIPVTLELGGKDPMIVFADAPLERAVQAALWGGLMNSGQVCMSVERVYVERSIFDRFVLGLVEEVGRLRQGREDGSDIGAMTSLQQVEIVRSQVEDALARGARLLTGQPPSNWDLSRGLFVPPMVLTDVTPDMKVMREETFGPVLPVMPFDSEDEAITLANDTPYGLSASVWSRDVNRARRVASRLVCGNALVNDVVITVANHHLPYGGEKASGIGRYHGEVGMRQFCVQTSVMVDKGRRRRELNWFPYAGKYALFRELAASFYGPTRHWIRFLRAYLRLQRLSRKVEGRE
jgi:acyl-CoA reductase-like NAD-dependent aldehyde dehydrogenase